MEAKERAARRQEIEGVLNAKVEASANAVNAGTKSAEAHHRDVEAAHKERRAALKEVGDEVADPAARAAVTQGEINEVNAKVRAAMAALRKRVSEAVTSFGKKEIPKEIRDAEVDAATDEAAATVSAAVSEALKPSV